MSIQAVAWALEQDIPNTGLKLLLVVLCNHADKGSGELYLRHSTAEREASMSRSSVQRHVKALATMGILEIGRTFERTGRQSANSYRIVFDAEEQKRVAEAYKGCQGDTLFDCESTGGKLVDDTAGEGVSVTPRGTTADTGEGVTDDTPNTNHPSEPNNPPAPQGGWRKVFDELWKSWPQAYLPNNRDVAERIFGQLTEVQRAQAVAVCDAYLRAFVLRKQKPKLITYLRGAFVEFVDAPPVDNDGEFVITPERPEWSAWMGVIRRMHGERGIEISQRQRRIVRKTRWPIGFSLDPSVTNLAT